MVEEIGIEKLVVEICSRGIIVSGGVQGCRTYIGGSLTETCPEEIHHRKIGLGYRRIEEEIHAGRTAQRPVHRHIVLHSVAVIPDRAHDRVLHHRGTETSADGEEGLLVGVAEKAAEVVREIRLEVGITETEVQRVGIIRHRHQLSDGRLGGAPTVKHPHFRIVVEFITEHSLRSPSPGGVGRVYGLHCVLGHIGRDGRLKGCSYLNAEFALLVLDIHSGVMVLGNIGDRAGIDAVLHLLRIVEDARGEIFRQCSGIPDFLVGEGTRPIVAVGGLHIEVVPQGLGV